jgi:hypothetical protein
MTLDEFLQLRQTQLPAVLLHVQKTVGLGAEDVLLAVGSIVEGLGNSRSDLDLLLITPRDLGPRAARGSVTLVAGKCIIDVRVIKVAEIGELLARFESWSHSPWDLTHAAPFTPAERILLHRLHHGLLLHRGDEEQVTARIPALIDLARLKLHVARQMTRTIQVDMAGYREVGDYRSLVFAAQEVLGHAVDALLAGYQVTNPLPKWRSRLLGSLPRDWEQSLRQRPTGLAAADLVFRLHRAPVRPDRELVLKHALRITTFARAVFLWAETTLVKGSSAKSKTAAWPRVTRKDGETPLPYLDFDVDFFLTNGHVTVARLNEFSETIKMSPTEFSLALLFDGATTAREAERFVYGSQSKKKVVENLISNVVRAGFDISPRKKHK